MLGSSSIVLPFYTAYSCILKKLNKLYIKGKPLYTCSNTSISLNNDQPNPREHRTLRKPAIIEQQFSYIRTPHQSAKGRIRLETHPFLTVPEVKEETFAVRGLLKQESPEKMYKEHSTLRATVHKHPSKKVAHRKRDTKTEEIQFCRQNCNASP